jgi:hypothetical protein
MRQVRIQRGAHAECRCKLLEAHYGTEAEKKKYHHPASNSVDAIRAWLHMWSMWCFIDYVGCILVAHFAEQEFKTRVSSETQVEFVEMHVDLFREFVQEQAFSLGGIMWNSGKNDTKSLKEQRDVWRRRTKRCVTRFYIFQHQILESPLKYIPPTVVAWMTSPGSISMYPCDGLKPEGRVISDWERRNCPWYMEFNNWNFYPTVEEEDAAQALKDGRDPTDFFDTTRLPHITPELVRGASAVEAMFTEPIYDGKKTRKEKEVSTLIDVSTSSTHGAAGKY